MTTILRGLHHVTATVDAAQPDLDFCVALLGLRLVKQTVNFDNRHVYHFYYGDERGTPGTLWTTFPYRGHGVRVGTIGAGQVVTTAFSVPLTSIASWQARLVDAGLVVDASLIFGEPHLVVTDPSGLRIAIVGTTDDERGPWTQVVGEALAVRGLHSVTLAVRDAGPTLAFLHEVLGCTVGVAERQRTRVAVGPGGTGAQLDVVQVTEGPRAINGLGTVHHVALAIASEDAQLALRETLVHRGVEVTPVKDRQYFRSIYFREPGGVLIEVATLAPGFDVDEPLSSLGRALKLPAWQEPHRADIEAGLPPIAVPSQAGG